MWRPLWDLGPCVSTLELDSGIRKNGEPQARSRPLTHWPVVRDIDQEKRKMLVDNGQRTMAVAPVFA
ncbi:hypothetical protein NEUTE2DRAFT_129981 [Neurospora tetrasperma FGSC 2509]|nr:hypothetical protein NEUTE2DRAFT_129981 [Neurospora tetrasperma FGSC 2509]